MLPSRVLQLLDIAADVDVQVWLDGGWGVDALLCEQHRDHEDIDLVVRMDDIERLQAALAPHGFAVADDCLPTRLVLKGMDGEQVDVHPVTFDRDGCGWQAQAAPDGTDCLYPADQFTHGLIAGRSVPCLGPVVQLEHHSGYAPRPHDVDDMRRLTARFDLSMPTGYPDP